MSGPRIAFRALFFWLLSIGFHLFSLVFGSGSFYRLLRLPKTQKPRGKPKKPKKKTKDSEECLGQGLCSEALFFFFFFFGFPRVFLVFGSGSFYRLLRLPKTQKPRKKKKTKKQRILRNVWAKDFVQRHHVFFLFCWFYSSFFCF